MTDTDAIRTEMAKVMTLEPGAKLAESKSLCFNDILTTF